MGLPVGSPISGIGGGVIIKPVMDAVSGLSVSSISFLSGCTVLAMSVVSVLRGRGGEAKIDLKKGTLLAIGGAIGDVSGKMIFDVIKSSFDSEGLLGPINLAVLYYFFSMDTKTAALNSLYIILFSQIASFCSTVFQGKVPESIL